MSVEDHDSQRLQASGYQLLQVSNPQNDSLFCCLHQDLEAEKESEKSVFHLHIRVILSIPPTVHAINFILCVYTYAHKRLAFA